jgi:hypothetical protein
MVWLIGFIGLACQTSPPVSQNGTEAAMNPFFSELRSLNQTIRNFQDLLKKNPDEKVFEEYAEILERKTRALKNNFESEVEQNEDIASWLLLIEKNIPELKNKSADIRKAAQNKLSDTNDALAAKLKLN